MNVNYYGLIQALSNNNSRIYKENLLNQYKNDEILKRIFHLAYNPYIQFWIKKIPEYSKNSGEITISFALDQLNSLSDRTFTGHAGIKYLKNILESLSESNAKVIELIIKKDLDCGVSVATINKVWPNLIPEFKIMKCHDTIEHIKFPAIGQPKIDSSRGILECIDQETGEFVARSSSGRVVDIGDDFKSHVKVLMHTGEKFDGEFICYESSEHHAKPLDRRTSNGIISKAIKGTISDYEKSTIRFIVWDIVDETSTLPYKYRLDALSSRFFAPGLPYKISLIESRKLDTIEDAYKHFDEVVAEGGEGIIVKNYDGIWEGKRVKSQGKMKEEHEVELRIIDYTPHRKSPELNGAFICQTECGKGIFRIGSGLTDYLRETPFNQLYDKIVTVRFNQLIGNKKTKEIDLYLPRIVELRHDKIEADTLQRIYDIIEAKKNK